MGIEPPFFTTPSQICPKRISLINKGLSPYFKCCDRRRHVEIDGCLFIVTCSNNGNRSPFDHRSFGRPFGFCERGEESCTEDEAFHGAGKVNALGAIPPRFWSEKKVWTFGVKLNIVR